MRKLLGVGFAAVVVACMSTAMAKELKSGLQPGDRVGAYTVVKCTGNANDGVDDGAKLCYRCKLGNRPVVAIFVRNADNDQLADLMKELEKVVTKNTDKKFASFVNLLGKDQEAMEKSAKALVKKAETENIAVVVPVDQPNGPENFKLDPEADLTVLVYTEGKVKANHSFEKDKLDEEGIKAIVADAKSMLK